MHKQTMHEADAFSSAMLPPGRTDSRSQGEGRLPTHKAGGTSFPFASLSRLRAMPCRALTTSELREHIAALHD